MQTDQSTIPRTPTRRPPTQARLWTLYKSDQRIECELHVRDDSAGKKRIDVRVLRDGLWCTGGRFETTADALAHGEQLLNDLRATGWGVGDTR